MSDSSSDSAPSQPRKEKLHIPFLEMLKSIPEFVGLRFNEEPEYEVLQRYGEFELRRYSKQLRAKVTLKGLSFEEFRKVGFHKLAAYIFG